MTAGWRSTWQHLNRRKHNVELLHSLASAIPQFASVSVAMDVGKRSSMVRAGASGFTGVAGAKPLCVLRSDSASTKVPNPKHDNH